MRLCVFALRFCVLLPKKRILVSLWCIVVLLCVYLFAYGNIFAFYKRKNAKTHLKLLRISSCVLQTKKRKVGFFHARVAYAFDSTRVTE